MGDTSGLTTIVTDESTPNRNSVAIGLPVVVNAGSAS